jgi:hypothetical protein
MNNYSLFRPFFVRLAVGHAIMEDNSRVGGTMYAV